MSFSSIPLTISIRLILIQYPSPEHYESLINRPQPTIVHFLGSADLGNPEFECLQLGSVETFYVNLSEFSVPDAPSDLPVTILFKENQKLDTAEGGFIPKLFDLVARAERES